MSDRERHLTDLRIVAAHDAATNCARDNAIAVVTLRSGVQITGLLEKTTVNLAAPGADTTLHVRMEAHGGWATILFSEVAAIEAHRR